ncbi:hypothetical protein EIN_487770 [Entamoeba invadens IP1]|uniref:Uncharacterized protein n=1 Tax=Entamoeba invadens IP1 TaxID=370355 RepID=A0A0A1U8B0_ENTIV|nr:hypothetical protein EIN_487770 [Entamoeba invadens IP1]ELP89275.1 hypothetical protein EIN_487770 [Entamoeba invadens IP1]|eukprot:XP_004256046.1 hypothetical protein EIN_487770 [Entamoeba invadens IP1]
MILVLLLVASGLSACVKKSENECYKAVGCVWNQVENVCEGHNLLHNEKHFTDYVLQFLKGVGSIIGKVFWPVSYLLENPVYIFYILLVFVFIAGVAALISSAELKMFNPATAKVFNTKME